MEAIFIPWMDIVATRPCLPPNYVIWKFGRTVEFRPYEPSMRIAFYYRGCLAVDLSNTP